MKNRLGYSSQTKSEDGTKKLMAATIRDIARLSGFGVGTVSRVLNGSPSVKEETRDQVLRVAKRLRYKPNKLAKMLVTGRYTDTTIGILLPLITHRFALEIIGGVYSRLNELGYNLLVFNIGKKREEVFENIRYVNFCGLLVLINPLTDEEKKMLEEHYTQFIYLDYYEEGENSIYFNNQKGGGLAASYLIQKSCKRIVFVGDLAETQQKVERLEGFKAELAAHDLSLVDEKYIHKDEEEAYRFTLDTIRKDEADGIFYYCDDLALGGLRAKKKIGSSIRIIGYDDIQAAGYLGLSTVRQSAKTIGQLGAQRIVELIERTSILERSKLISECLNPELVDRDS